jgi:hypothetical protein
MRRNAPKTNPIGTLRREAITARKVGVGARCFCGEDRPAGLIAGSSPIMCAACQRAAEERTEMDLHHPFGRANSPATISVPVSDHRAILSVGQMGWPKSTLSNPEGSPLLAGAACVRGFVDSTFYLLEQGLLWVAEMLELLDGVLVKRLGSKWWANSEIGRFAPTKKPDAKS